MTSLNKCSLVNDTNIYIFMVHVLQHPQLAVRSFSVDSGLKRSREFFYGDLDACLVIHGRTVMRIGTCN
jgi:hypothetical protein